MESCRSLRRSAPSPRTRREGWDEGQLSPYQGLGIVLLTRKDKRRNTMPQNPPIIAGTRIGHVHLKVADLDRALGFYCGVLGFELMQRLSSGAAFISAGGYHHHIGLNTWESKGGHPPPPGTTGLFHTAILYPTRPALADALHRLISAGIELDGASDHGVSEGNAGLDQSMQRIRERGDLLRQRVA